MAVYKKLQASFTGGEISPRMLARTDLSMYERSAKTVTNGYPLTHGGVTRRAGTCFISEVDDSSNDVRLIPFVTSKTRAYVLVFNNGKIEFIRNKAFILSGPTPYSISHPYSDSELAEVTYAQAGSLMFFAHPNHPPKQLTRISDTNWTLTNVITDTLAVSDFFYENNFIRFKIVTSGDGHDVGDFYQIVTDGVGGFTVGGPFNGSGGAAPVGAMTAVSVNTNNLTAETWTVTCVVKATNREEWDVSGSVTGFAPVQWSTGDYPKAVSFHSQRLFYAGSNTRPQTIWGSTVGDFTNFTLGPEADDALNFTIASNSFDQIIHLESARQLMIFSYGAEFTLTGSAAGLAPFAADIRRHTMHGSAEIKPIRIGQEVLFVQKDLKKVRAISFDVTLDANVAPEITLLAEHITREGDADGLVDMTFAQDPDYISWIVRDDGAALSLTHMRDQEVTAWAKHTSGDGLFKAVTTIPEGTTDTVYWCVERVIDGNTNKYIEYFCEGTYLDSNLSATSGTPTDTWSGLDHLEGETISVVADGKVQPDVTVSGGSVTIQDAASAVTFGLNYRTTLEMLHPEVPLGDGSAQGRQLTIKNATIRLQDTIGLEVNGIDIPVMEFPHVLGDPPDRFTGDKVAYVQGWTFPNNLLIEQTLPMPWTVLGVIVKVEVNE